MIKKTIVFLLLVGFSNFVFAQTAKDFENSWNFYKKRVFQGANLEERVKIIDRILMKYKGKGIDIS